MSRPRIETWVKYYLVLALFSGIITSIATFSKNELAAGLLLVGLSSMVAMVIWHSPLHQESMFKAAGLVVLLAIPIAFLENWHLGLWVLIIGDWSIILWAAAIIIRTYSGPRPQ